jgi:hypothetical protein
MKGGASRLALFGWYLVERKQKGNEGEKGEIDPQHDDDTRRSADPFSFRTDGTHTEPLDALYSSPSSRLRISAVWSGS